MVTYIPPEYQRIMAAWQKAAMIRNVNPDHHRLDRSGRVMNWTDFENRQSRHGWKLKAFRSENMNVEEAVHIDTNEEH